MPKTPHPVCYQTYLYAYAMEHTCMLSDIPVCYQTYLYAIRHTCIPSNICMLSKEAYILACQSSQRTLSKEPMYHDKRANESSQKPLYPHPRANVPSQKRHRPWLVKGANVPSLKSHATLTKETMYHYKRANVP